MVLEFSGMMTRWSRAVQWYRTRLDGGGRVAEEHSSLPRSSQEETLLNLAIESWRFGRVFSRVLAKLDVTEAARFASQWRYFQKRVDESLSTMGMRLVNLEGQPFDPGIAASALNLADFGPEDRLVVEQMVEPIVMGADGLVRPGTVLLGKLGS